MNEKRNPIPSIPISQKNGLTNQWPIQPREKGKLPEKNWTDLPPALRRKYSEQ